MMKKFFANLLICFILLGITCTSYAANWQWITSTDIITLSFDTTSIRPSESGRYFVWIKQEYTEAEGKNLSNKFQYDKPIAYFLIREEIDYKNEAIGTQSTIAYANDGSVMGSYTNKFYDFTPVIPGTVGEIQFLVTLKEYQKQYSKI